MEAHPTHTVGATCNVTLKQITPSFNYSPQPRLDEIDYTTELVVLLSFNNYDKIEHHACDDELECLRKPYCYISKYKVTNQPDDKKLVFLVDPKTLCFDVLTAVTDDGLPDYVTPGVWKAVKYGMCSFILDNNVNYTQKHNPMLKYEMSIDVDVTTHHFVNHNDGPDDDSLWSKPFVRGVEEDERTKSLRKSLEKKIYNWMKTTMII
ncbi:hypothetical protein SOVF_083630 [Spinacia oleracea]|nr:hypothetical protein SOVF_083630 [Spinacia oleracea]